MNRYNNWRKRRLIIVGTAFFVLYLCFRFTRQTVETSAVFLNTKPVEVWEYVADFSNMISLNPTITKFNILNESGNMEHWKYTVEYTETLSHWPYLENISVASFAVRPDGKDFLILSTHNTCFFVGRFCLRSAGEFRFSSSGKQHTKCTEIVTFECPALFGSFCRREAEFQRRSIMNNLKEQFKYPVM